MVPHDSGPVIVVMAGGTGGHIFPALATAAELESRGYRVHWLGTPGSMEADLVPRHGFEISFIPITGVRGKKMLYWLKAPWLIGKSILKAMALLREQKPVCVLGMGGYVTGPGGVAAKLLGIPLVIHEQNAIPGLTNKLLSSLATKVLEAFPGTFSGKKFKKVKRKLFTTGNPVRSSIASENDYHAGKSLKLLVIGGSRGAVAINKLIPQLLARYKGGLDIWHQTGKNNIDDCLSDYRKLEADDIKSYKVEPFIDDMAQAYEWADIVLCRSGALTVSELAVAGRPAILVPFPYAVDDHQTANGRYLTDNGAAVMIQQDQLDEEALTTLLMSLGRDPARLQSMAAAAKSVGRSRATREVADHCLEVCHG
ncbi:undecaprenyldiphospho-muramoylpentapeptide beta-N-acetylglucosaminyltransferase [Endozoicomonas sp. Mp262]|uniref:undecaprenyldiphospho-muramoylpentapeptide beta-N-acetylglucosaminyltransferase n=1 Tax=Endozoicomonas sp. Mp262 TaxID=2919499 RepID=UPI0021D8E8D4